MLNMMILMNKRKGNDMNKKQAMATAKEWSMDPDNNYGQALVLQERKGYSVCADCSEGFKIVAKFIKGKQEEI